MMQADARIGALVGVLCLIGCAQTSSGDGPDVAQSMESQVLTPPSAAPTTTLPAIVPAPAFSPPPPAGSVDGGNPFGLTADPHVTDDDAGVDFELSGPTTLLLVLDKSGSMGGFWTSATKWHAGNEALVSGLAPLVRDLTLGAILFPLQGECGVPELDGGQQYPFEPGEGFLSRWHDTYPTLVPEGGTPLSQALQAADRALAGAEAAGLYEHKLKVMVLTDGEPNCEGDEALLTALPAQWLERGIHTYVLGLPGSSPAEETLQRIAVAGGTGTFRQPGSPTALQHDIAAAAAQ